MPRPMINPDLSNTDEVLIGLKNDFVAALESGDADNVAAAQVAMAHHIQLGVLDQAKREAVEAARMEAADQHARAARNMNYLTVDERKYYNAVIEANGFETAEVVSLMPATIIDRVFEDLKKKHPLLDKINFVNTGGVTRWITRTNDAEAAWWGPLCDTIKKKLSAAFKMEDMNLYKLSAYMPVCKSMLVLGPEWLDTYVRTVLGESIAMALELAIVNGTGKDQPIGMMKNLAGAVVEGVYPDKTPVALTEFTPASIGTAIMAPLTKNGTKIVDAADVVFIVNPLDYWSKIYQTVMTKNLNGQWVSNFLFPMENIIQSVAVPQGKMVTGEAPNYFMGVGMSQKIEHSDEYKFLEDQRTYLTKFLGNGKAKDNESFTVFDISGMAPAV
ncbi:phage major capsid protein [Acetoanaerobium noterae]|uniref:phage major capsid protein n=1 Tax=Acetoanaerobium noterae TaxID=745369 RepID=UPI0032424B79